MALCTELIQSELKAKSGLLSGSMAYRPKLTILPIGYGGARLWSPSRKIVAVPTPACTTVYYWQRLGFRGKSNPFRPL